VKDKIDDFSSIGDNTPDAIGPVPIVESASSAYWSNVMLSHKFQEESSLYSVSNNKPFVTFLYIVVFVLKANTILPLFFRSSLYIIVMWGSIVCTL
jgi:hypothetical protein